MYVCTGLKLKGVCVMVTRPFFKSAGLFSFSVMFIASMIAGTELYAQNGDAPQGKETPKITQHGDQNEGDPNGSKSSPPPEMRDRTPEDMADHMSTMLTDRLGLNDNQKKSVYDIVLNYASTHNRSDFERKELDSKIDEVLTAEQKEKFKEFITNTPPKNTPSVNEPGSR